MLAADAQASAAQNNARPLPTLSHGPFRRYPENHNATIHTGRPTKATVTPFQRTKPVAPEKVVAGLQHLGLQARAAGQSAVHARGRCGRVGAARPVPFVLYWGKGPRWWLDEPDTTCLDYLVGFAERVRAIYQPGASVKLIFTDTHANLNGHTPHEIEEYFGEVEVAARQRGFDACWLSELVFNAERAGAIERDRRGSARGDAPQAWRVRREMVSRRRHARSRRRALLQDEHDREARGAACLPARDLRHLQRQRIPLPVPGADADLLHVFAPARDEREALVPAGPASRCAAE